MSKMISLATHLQKESEITQIFSAWWTFKQKQGPENFPAKMAAGDWDDQIMNFDPGEALEEMEAAGVKAGPHTAIYGRRADGTAWISIGDPENGPHFQCDFDAPAWVFKALGVLPDQEFNKTQGTKT
jgi:hypothetical protein